MQELSDMSGLPFETVKNLCYGKVSDPRLSTITALCKALGIYYCQLVDGHIYEEAKESELINNYRKCGNHGKSIIELISKTQAKAATLERNDNNKRMIDCLVPTTQLVDGIHNAPAELKKYLLQTRTSILGTKLQPIILLIIIFAMVMLYYYNIAIQTLVKWRYLRMVQMLISEF